MVEQEGLLSRSPAMTPTLTKLFAELPLKKHQKTQKTQKIQITFTLKNCQRILRVQDNNIYFHVIYLFLTPQCKLVIYIMLNAIVVNHSLISTTGHCESYNEVWLETVFVTDTKVLVGCQAARDSQ